MSEYWGQLVLTLAGIFLTFRVASLRIALSIARRVEKGKHVRVVLFGIPVLEVVGEKENNESREQQVNVQIPAVAAFDIQSLISPMLSNTETSTVNELKEQDLLRRKV